MRTHIQAMRTAGLLLTAALPWGCAHQPTVVGTWSGTARTNQGATAQTTFTFTADGHETLAAQISNGPLRMTLGSTGFYTVSGTALTQTITTVTMNGKTRTLPPQNAARETDQFTLSGDTLTLTKPGSPTPLVLTRQNS
jgi:hypothetical protein